jgi:hypothetical protein
LEGVTLGAVQKLLECAREPTPLATQLTGLPSVKSTLLEALAGRADEGALSTYLLGEASTATPLSSELIKVIAAVAKPRNDASHMKPMPKSTFDELEGALISGGHHLARVLELVPVLGMPLTAASVATLSGR